MMNRPFYPAREHELALGLPGQLIQRAAFAHAFAAHSKLQREAVAAKLWPNDTVVRAAVGPADTATPAWAGALAITAVADFVTSLGTTSAFSRVAADAIKVSMNGVGQVTLPRRTTPPTADEVPWVVEGEPAPVVRISVTGGPVLIPKKLLSIVVATNELLGSSAAEAVFTELMRESVSFSLDAAAFSNVAADTARPAGLLEGIAALAATAGGGDAAQLGDLEKLTAAIADNVDDIVFVAHPAQALSIRLRRTNFDIPVFGTRGVAAGTIIAVDPRAVAYAFGTEPRFEASTETVLHMSDTPDQIGTAGVPPVVAAPARSMFQTGCAALKVRLPITWGLRSPGAVAWISGATWG